MPNKYWTFSGQGIDPLFNIIIPQSNKKCKKNIKRKVERTYKGMVLCMRYTTAVNPSVAASRASNPFGSEADGCLP